MSVSFLLIKSKTKTLLKQCKKVKEKSVANFIPRGFAKEIIDQFLDLDSKIKSAFDERRDARQ